MLEGIDYNLRQLAIQLYIRPMTYKQMEKYWLIKDPRFSEIFYGTVAPILESYMDKGHRYYKLRKENDNG
jgi:hypothetical protein